MGSVASSAMRMKKGLAVWLVGGMLTAGGLIVGTHGSAACSLLAYTPHKNVATGRIAGTGGQGTTCNYRKITVQVRQQRTLQPDDVIASYTQTIGNTTFTPVSNKYHGKVRTRTTASSGGQSESLWVTL